VAESVIAFRDARDWRQFHRPKNLAAAIAVEAAELQEVFLWSEVLPAEEVRKDADRMAKVESEMADVAIYLLLMANELEINLAEAIARKMQRNESRYPAAEHRGVARKTDRSDKDSR
jgi:NTP pyrophosphatase (non-canonical NTP hydrolase)